MLFSLVLTAEAWLFEAALAEAGESETATLEAGSALTGATLLAEAALLLEAEVASLAAEVASCCTTCSVFADVSGSVVAACAVAPLPNKSQPQRQLIQLQHSVSAKRTVENVRLTYFL